MINQRPDFIARLRHYVATDGADTIDEYGRVGLRPNRGSAVLLAALADYLEGSGVPPGDQYENWFAKLDRIIVDAFVAFRRELRFAEVRRSFAKECGGDEIPDLVDVHVGGLGRLMVSKDIARIVTALAGTPEQGGGDWLRAELEARFDAQMMCIDQAWRAFVRLAYVKMMARIKEERHRGNAGMFGATQLLTYAMAGRVMFTFSRGKDDAPSITYVADDGDPYGYRSGPNVPHCPYTDCVAMITEVTSLWDIDKMRRSDGVGFG